MGRKRLKTGIEFYCEEKGSGKSSFWDTVLDYIFECVCMILLLYGAICGLYASCNIPQERKVILFFMLILTGITFAALEYRKSPIVLIIYIAVCALILFRSARINWIAIKYFASYYVEFINKYFGTNLIVKLSEEDRMLSQSTGLFVFQVFLSWIVVFMTGILRKLYKKSLVALISPILVFSLIFIVGLIPESQYLFAFLIGFLPLSISGKEKDKRLGVQAKLTTLVSAGALVLICGCLLPEPVYQKHFDSMISIKKDIQNAKSSEIIKDISYYLSDRGGLSGQLFTTGYGGMNSGELGAKDKIKFDKKTDFVLTTTLAELQKHNYEVYLRSYVGSNYSNRLWGDLNKEQQKEYEKLTKEYNYNFENLLSDMLKLRNLYMNDSYDESRSQDYVLFNIKKEDIGRKHMLLPYAVNDDVREKNGLLYAKDAKGKRVYSEEVNKLGILPPYHNSYFDYDYVNNQKLYDVLRDLMYQYANVLHASDTESDTDSRLEDKFYKELEKYAQKEVSYRKFVYDTYTKVPDNVAPKLRNEMNNLTFSLNEFDLGNVKFNGDFSDFFNDNLVYAEVWWCQTFLEQSAKYSLEPGRTPDDKDFVDYFLYENKEGYCTYFATAATLFLRLQGLPARYVEGYKVSYEDFARKGKKVTLDGKKAYQLNVTDEAAHAWVEVYVNGCGWIPFDVTPGRGNEGVVKNSEDDKDVTTTIVPPSPSVLINPPTKSPAETVNTPEPSGATIKGTNTGNTKENNSRGKDIFSAVFIILLLVASVFVRRWIIKRTKYKKEFQSDNNKRVKYYYQELDSITKVYCKKSRKGEIGDNIQAIAADFDNISEEELSKFITIVEKATFGGKPVSDYECMKCKVLYQNVRKELYDKASIVKRIYYEVYRVF